MIRVKPVLIILLVLTLGIYGCGLCPAYVRSQPDYLKVSNMVLYGGTKGEVKTGFGKPDDIQVFDDKSEIWTYYNRQDSRTFKFAFTKKGKLASTLVGDKLVTSGETIGLAGENLRKEVK